MKNRLHPGWHFLPPATRRYSLISVVTALLLFPCGLLQAQQNGVADAPNEQLKQTVRHTLKKNSGLLQLVENNGQEGLSPEVLAYFTSANQAVFVEKDRLRIVVLEYRKENKKATLQSDRRSPADAAINYQYRSNSFSILFSGSPGWSRMEMISPLDVQRNFMQRMPEGLRQQSARSYKELVLHDVYKGIDLRLYSQENGQLEFDWVVWPGANADQIRLQFQGQRQLKLSATGQLTVGLGIGSFTLRVPESYLVTPQGKKPVKAAFAMSGKNTVRFTGLRNRDKKYPLIIDPDLLWGTFFDGAQTNFDEYLYGIEFNYTNQLIYCVGAVNLQISTAYAAALANGYDTTFAATPDALVYAVSKDGQFVRYLTYLGGLKADVGVGVAVSTSFIYVCGYTESPDFPVTLQSDTLYPAFDSVYHAGKEGFVAVFSLKLDSLHYCSFLGGDGDDEALTIRSTGDSTFYVSLSSTDTLPIASPNYIYNYADSIFSGNSEAWIGKFSSFSTLDFGTYIGGSSDDLVNDFQLLSNGDIVFAGSTKNITEVNASIPDNGTGQEALFGRIAVPSSAPVSFSILDKIGGSGSDQGWGIYSSGDSVSIMVGQTSSNNFPLGTGPVFQTTRNGQIEGFIAKIYNNGGPGYKATYTGGSDDDILVAVRPVTVNNTVALLAWGSTASTDLAVRNFNSGTFYSPNNSGGLDMLFVICDIDLQSKYYLSYVGGSANDYLGITGAPVGSNHLFYNDVDSVLYVGTTTHSSQTTHAPLFVGRGPADLFNTGVPVFDQTKGNSNNDTHVIFAISTRGLFAVLPLQWEYVKAALTPDCNGRISWKMIQEDKIAVYEVERSFDGVFFQPIGSLPASAGSYQFTDMGLHTANSNAWYRIAAIDRTGRKEYSAVQLVRPCGQAAGDIIVYPTVVTHSFTITGNAGSAGEAITYSMVDVSGRTVLPAQKITLSGSYTVYLDKFIPDGTYFVTLHNSASGQLLGTKKIVVTH